MLTHWSYTFLALAHRNKLLSVLHRLLNTNMLAGSLLARLWPFAINYWWKPYVAYRQAAFLILSGLVMIERIHSSLSHPHYLSPWVTGDMNGKYTFTIFFKTIKFSALEINTSPSTTTHKNLENHTFSNILVENLPFDFQKNKTKHNGAWIKSRYKLSNGSLHPWHCIMNIWHVSQCLLQRKSIKWTHLNHASPNSQHVNIFASKHWDGTVNRNAFSWRTLACCYP